MVHIARRDCSHASRASTPLLCFPTDSLCCILATRWHITIKCVRSLSENKQQPYSIWSLSSESQPLCCVCFSWKLLAGSRSCLDDSWWNRDKPLTDRSECCYVRPIRHRGLLAGRSHIRTYPSLHIRMSLKWFPLVPSKIIFVSCMHWRSSFFTPKLL